MIINHNVFIDSETNIDKGGAMAIGDPMFRDPDSDDLTEMVYIPSALPIISNISIDSLMRHFDDGCFDKTSTSHIRHVVEVLCGESGMGGLLYQSVRNWLNGGVETAWLGFLDQLFASIYGLPRIYAESTVFNVSDAMLTADEVNEALVKEAWYKARFRDLMLALQAGGTVRGFRYAVQAVMYCDCDIYETWRYLKQDFKVGRLGYTIYNEVVICPYDKNVTEQQKELLLRILDRLKPAETVVTIDMNGLEAFKDREVRSISASSTYFEIIKTLTNSVDNSKLPSKSQMFADDFAYGYDAYLNLATGESTEVRKPLQSRTQEYSEYYTYDKSSAAQVVEVDYTTLNAKDEEMPEDNYSERESTTKWSAWMTFPIQDSPDNYPGGKYGRTPMKEPAVNKDGTPYIFEWDSQEAFEKWYGDDVIKNGGQVKGHQFRTKLSVSNTTTTYLPEMSLVTVEDFTNNMQVLPDVEPQDENVYSKTVMKGMQ